MTLTISNLPPIEHNSSADELTEMFAKTTLIDAVACIIYYKSELLAKGEIEIITRFNAPETIRDCGREYITRQFENINVTLQGIAVGSLVLLIKCKKDEVEATIEKLKNSKLVFDIPKIGKTKIKYDDTEIAPSYLPTDDSKVDYICNFGNEETIIKGVNVLPANLSQAKRCLGKTLENKQCGNRRKVDPPFCHHHVKDGQRKKFERYADTLKSSDDDNDDNVPEWWPEEAKVYNKREAERKARKDD